MGATVNWALAWYDWSFTALVTTALGAMSAIAWQLRKI